MFSFPEFPPFRSVSNFLADTSCYSLPSVNDPKRLQARILKNLLYYQSNYILCAAIILCLFWIRFPLTLSVGCLALCGLLLATYGIGLFISRGWIWVLSVIALQTYIIYHHFGAILMFICAIGLAVIGVLTHASVRKRNLKNKLANTAESLGLKATAVGVLLDHLGLTDTDT